ncbi:FAD-dependent monooxygenase [Rheinheimera sp. WS51]|uniref:FAD-dependent monooxygenase n=1 Tax=Rheinheimera sp. WS51 TaxID=3425886 RepID=UPI003D8D5487
MINRAENSCIGIIGAGPIGLALAARLAGFGIKSVILDRSAHLLPKGSKACLIQGDALEVLDKIGCADPIAEEGIHWRTARTYIRNVERITQEFPERAGYGEFVNISQYRIEQELLAWVENHSLVQVCWSHEVIGYNQGKNQVTVTAKTPSIEKDFNFDYLVACDGVGSTMRKLTGVKFNGYTHKDRFLITDIKANIPLTKERHFHFDPDFNRGRQLVMHPQPNNIWRIDWQLSPDADIEAEKANGKLDARIKAVIGDIPYNIEWLSTYRFNQCVIEKFKIGNIFFAGDAAHSFPPYGSRGMNSGLADADNLAWKMAAVLKGHADESLLDSYHTERFDAAQENLRVTEATIKFMVPPTPLKRLVRNIKLSLSVLWKGMRGQVDHGKMTQPYTYKQSALIDTSDSRFVGQFSPDVAIFVDGKKTRLRKLMGQSFLCFYVGELQGLAEFSKQAELLNNYANVTFVAAFPVGDEIGQVPDNIDVVRYDDILFFETLKCGDRSMYVFRPDSHIASHNQVSSGMDINQIIACASGCEAIPVDMAKAS